MLDLTVIILTFNEEIHIKRCLDNVSSIAQRIVLVDCFSTDKTVEIVQSYANVKVLQHAWPDGKQAEQFNWALQHAEIKTKWVLRLDADEILTSELKEELKTKLPLMKEPETGIILKRRHYFMNKWMKRGIYPIKLIRIFRYGKAVCENRLMDEHIQLLEGRAVEFNHDFIDWNLNDISLFCHKHVDYSVREAADLLDIEFNLSGVALEDASRNISDQAKTKRVLKHKYAKQPLFWRSFAYFGYRYFLKGACLDGVEGFLWTFIQGWWYRTLVDAKVYEIKKACGTDKERMKKYLDEHYHIKL